jgi:hypothetical protein
MSEHLYLISLGVLFGTPLLVFGMKYLSSAYQARARTASENAYKELAQKAAAAQTESAASLAIIQGELSDVRTRLAAVEKILKDVE